jgi:acyl carrier protein
VPEVVVSPQDFPAVIGLYERASLTARQDGAVGMARPAAQHERPQLATPYMPPRNQLEVQIAEVWQALLGITEIGIHDSFFDLGGHSLLATQLIGRLQRQFGVDLSLNMIFESQTIAELAERVETSRWTSQAAPDGMPPSSNDRVEIEL